ncbi:glutamine synthetase type III [bacterium]|nr:glutamine synthetase type III [bacterium]
MHRTRLQAINSIRKKGDFSSGNENAPKVSEAFGELIFSHSRMRASLTGERLIAFEKALAGEKPLTEDVAKVLAVEIKNWAVKNGATHFTHWFQPLTGLTAEKHDSFVGFDEKGEMVEGFSASQLIQSEPDASSFPSGGTRSTFEARGYTAWDISSPVFIREHAGERILCVPSVFVSYTGHSLDTKTGLMRSMSKLSQSATEFLAEIGENTKKVVTTVGVEQEYFLVDKNFVDLRPDLLLTGRTLIGRDMPKGQQLEDHYFGAIPTRVQAFMARAERELYRLGVPVKTRHNEVAPGQYEMAPVFENANLASDHNMLTMEVLRKTAKQDGMECLFHEKPFSGVNGSGKHNNWSMATAEGDNLLNPGKTPAQNLRFLAVLSCVLKAVNKHQVALRASIASHGNDHRLGANEAPPAIISVFMGDTLNKILSFIEKGGDLTQMSAEQSMIDFGFNTLPMLPKDNTDRNRTSPFAFTGNKFEFRAVGSSQAISYPVTILNAAVSEAFSEFTTKLREAKKTSISTESAVLQVTKEFVLESKAIRFEGDGYSQEWRDEAKKLGLKELLTTSDALAEFSKPEHHKFLIECGVYSEEEFGTILNVQLERYSKHISIEAETMKTLLRQYVLPAALEHQVSLAKGLKCVESVGGDTSLLRPQRESLKEVSEQINGAYMRLEELKALQLKAVKVEETGDLLALATLFSKEVRPAMEKLRDHCDVLESRVSDDLWPLPKYREMLFIR